MKILKSFLFEEDTDSKGSDEDLLKPLIDKAGVEQILGVLSNADVRSKVAKAIEPTFNKNALKKSLTQSGSSEKVANSPNTKIASKPKSTTGTKGPGSGSATPAAPAEEDKNKDNSSSKEEKEITNPLLKPTTSKKKENPLDIQLENNTYWKKGKGNSMKKTLKEANVLDQALKAAGLSNQNIQGVDAFIDMVVGALQDPKTAGKVKVGLQGLAKITDPQSAQRQLATLKSALQAAMKEKSLAAKEEKKAVTAPSEDSMVNPLKEARRRNEAFVSFLFEAEEHGTEEHAKEEAEKEKHEEEEHKKSLKASEEASKHLVSDLKNKSETAKKVKSAKDAVAVVKSLVAEFDLDEEEAKNLAAHLKDLV